MDENLYIKGTYFICNLSLIATMHGSNCNWPMIAPETMTNSAQTQRYCSCKRKPLDTNPCIKWSMRRILNASHMLRLEYRKRIYMQITL